MNGVLILVFLSSGLFLGWSLGANDAANIFGTAVGSKMITFRQAALVGSVFVILGAVISGSGAAHGLGKLGEVSAMPGAFIVALSSGLTVFFMTRFKLPVSTSQAIVGAIIGWNLFSGTPTDIQVVSKIVLTWVLCPILSAAIALMLYFLIRGLLRRSRIHLLRQDAVTRVLLLIAGAFGAYSLGANNIANVMGVFVPASPFTAVNLFGPVTLSSMQVLFLIGGVSIAIGIATYSRRVMETVGKNIFKLSPVTAFIVVLSSSLVLFLFASQSLHDWIRSIGLPALPLIPVSSSQAVVGAVLGIGIAKAGGNINLRVMGKISIGWVVTPAAAGGIAFILLFVMQNLFGQNVY